MPPALSAPDRHTRLVAASLLVEPWSSLLSDERVVHSDVYGARSARLVSLPDDLDSRVLDALDRSFKSAASAASSAAIRSAFAGPTIVTTGTASGKSLCFQLPTLEVLCSDSKARALYLYPTKALAQDQARALHAFGMQQAIAPAIYDGDTPRGERAAIRRRSNLVLTNPDMLHVGILPNHAAWAELFANLAFVVIDEAHVYRGVFGSHVANVLRRLRRVAARYGTEPRFLLASATIANPLELAERLTGLDEITLIGTDTAPTAQRTVAMWNPPLLDEQLGRRASPLTEAAELLERLVLEGARTICFMKSRRGVELILRHTVDRLNSSDRPDLAERIAPYRAGYTPQQRRELDRRLTSGELLGVVATDALELGIDIGTLDAAICVTFPGTVSSLRQMWGRAGRRGSGLAVFLAGEDALDQFFCRHPDEFLDRPVEAAILDHESPQIYAEHLVCAAHEAPLSDEDAGVLGAGWRAHADVLAAAGILRERVTGFVPRRADDYPAARVELRSASPDSFALIDGRSTSTSGAPTRCWRSNSTHAGLCSSRSRATTSPRPSARASPTSSASSTAARPSGSASPSAPWRFRRRCSASSARGSGTTR